LADYFNPLQKAILSHSDSTYFTYKDIPTEDEFASQWAQAIRANAMKDVHEDVERVDLSGQGKPASQWNKEMKVAFNHEILMYKVSHSGYAQFKQFHNSLMNMDHTYFTYKAFPTFTEYLRQVNSIQNKSYDYNESFGMAVFHVSTSDQLHKKITSLLHEEYAHECKYFGISAKEQQTARWHKNPLYKLGQGIKAVGYGTAGIAACLLGGCDPYNHHSQIVRTPN
jgi:hypothetical protein